MPEVLQLLQYLQQTFPNIVGLGPATANTPTDSIEITYDGATLRADYTGAEPNPAAVQSAADSFTPSPLPNWDSFLNALASTSGLYPAIAGSTMAPIITGRMVRLASGDEWGGATDPLVAAWNGAPPALDIVMRTALEAAAAANDIPLAVDENNLISVT